MMLFGAPPAARLRDRRPRRGGLLAGQVRHPDRAAAALAAGQGQRLDRGPDDPVDHPRRAARRPAGRPRGVAPAARASTCRCSTPASTPRPRRRSRSIVSLYVVAALFNLRIPRTEAPLQPLAHGVAGLVRDFSQLQRAPVERQARPDLAGDDDAVLGRLGQPALHRARLGRGGARLRHDAGLVAGRRGRDRHRRRRDRRVGARCGSTRPPA